MLSIRQNGDVTRNDARYTDGPRTQPAVTRELSEEDDERSERPDDPGEYVGLRPAALDGEDVGNEHRERQDNSRRAQKFLVHRFVQLKETSKERRRFV